MGDFGGFGGFGVQTKRIRDSFGEIYNVPIDLFDGSGDEMAHQFVLRERLERQAGQETNEPFKLQNLSPVPEPPNPMSDFSRSALGFGMKLNENLNPLMLAEPLKADWDEGRYVGQSVLSGLIDAHQRTREQGAEEFSRPYNPLSPSLNDIGTTVVGGLRYGLSGVPFVGPAISDAMNMAQEGNWSESLGAATGIGLGMGAPRLKGHFDDWRAAKNVHTPDMAITDPLISNSPEFRSEFPMQYRPGDFPNPITPDSPMQGPRVPMGTSASTIPERFPNLMEQLNADEVTVPRPPAGTWPERFDALGNAERANQRRRFGRYEEAAAEALQEPGTNATVFGALAPENVTEPWNPYPQDQFGLLPEAIREPAADANFGIDPTKRTFGLRPSGSTLGNMPEPIMDAPNPDIQPNAGIAEPPNTRYAETQLTDPSNVIPESMGEMTEPGAPPPVFEKSPDWNRLVELQKNGYVETMTHQDGTTVFKYDPKKAAELNKATQVVEATNPMRKPESMIDKSPILKSARDSWRFFIGESGEALLDRMGSAGQALKLATQQATADSFGFSGKQTAAITRAMRPWNTGAKRKAALEQMVDFVEKGTNSNNPDMQNLINVYRANDVVGTDTYKRFGLMVESLSGEAIPFKERKNYWPHRWERGTVDKNRTQILAAMMEPDPTTGKAMTLEQAEIALEKGKESGYGFLDALHARRSNLQGYRKDIDVIKGQYINMARKAFNEKVFGQMTDPESFVSKQLDIIGKEYGPQARIQAEQVMQRYLSKEIPTFDATLMGEVASGMSRFEAITKLGMSTVGNLLGGTAMVSSRTRMTNMAKAFGKSMTDAGRNAAEEMGSIGSLWRDSAQDVGYGSDVSKIYGIAGTEKHLRTFSALAGKYEAETLFKEVKSGGFRAENKMKQLQDLILEPDMQKVMQQDSLNPTQIDRAGNRMTDLTQGRADPMNLPRAWSHPNPMVNVVFQFKKYAWIHSRNLKEAMKRNPWAAPRLLGFMIASGEGVADIRALIKGTDRPENIQDRILDDLANSYGAGYIGDLWTAASQDSWQEGLGRLAPPAATDFAKFGTAAGDAIGSIFDEEEGIDFTALEEEAAGLVPIFGSRLKGAVKEANKE